MTTIQEIEQHWLKMGSLSDSCENVAADLEQNASNTHPAVDEAIELLRIMAKREREHLARIASQERGYRVLFEVAADFGQAIDRLKGALRPFAGAAAFFTKHDPEKRRLWWIVSTRRPDKVHPFDNLTIGDLQYAQEILAEIEAEDM